MASTWPSAGNGGSDGYSIWSIQLTAGRTVDRRRTASETTTVFVSVAEPWRMRMVYSPAASGTTRQTTSPLDGNHTAGVSARIPGGASSVKGSVVAAAGAPGAPATPGAPGRTCAVTSAGSFGVKPRYA